MKEIKFRGLGRNDGIWRYGFYVERKGYNYGMIYDEIGVGYKVKKETVGQYTRRKDRNVTEIYEGDILRCYLTKGDTYYTEVKFRKHNYSEISWEVVNGYSEFEEIVEVVGNIYENPDMITNLNLVNKQK